MRHVTLASLPSLLVVSCTGHTSLDFFWFGRSFLGTLLLAFHLPWLLLACDLRGSLELGPQGFCSPVWSRCGLLGDWPRIQWQRVSTGVSCLLDLRMIGGCWDDAIVLTLACSYVEFESAADLKTAIEKLDNREFKGNRVSCAVDVSSHSLPSLRLLYLTLYVYRLPLRAHPAGAAGLAPRHPVVAGRIRLPRMIVDHPELTALVGIPMAIASVARAVGTTTTNDFLRETTDRLPDGL